MNKRKILSLAMALSIVAIMAVGATLAYFTDTDEATNVFTVGSVDIDLSETVAVKDALTGNEVEGAVTSTDAGATYSNIMPGYTMDKKVTVTNTGKSDAYVRVTVKHNNYGAINSGLDDFYEAEFGKDAHAEIEAMYDKVFVGWNMKHTRDSGDRGVRHWLDKSDSKLIAVDYAYFPNASNCMFQLSNMFKTETEVNDNDWTLERDQAGTGYYSSKLEVGEAMYTFYLKLAATETYTLFDGLACPAEFNAEQAAMFDNLTIDIKAAAIQTVGFEDAAAAFTELAAECPIE